MTTAPATNRLEWPGTMSDFQAAVDRLKAGYQGAGDGGDKKISMAGPAADSTQMKQSPSWLAGFEKSLPNVWANGLGKNEALYQDARGQFGIVSMGNHWGSVTMGAPLLGVLERPLNGMWSKLPLGSILLGGGFSLVTGEAIDQLYPHTLNADGTTKLNTTNLLAKSGIALAMAMYGHRLFSTTGAMLGAAVLGLQVLVDLAGKRLDSIVLWIVNMWNKLTGKPPITVLSQGTVTARQDHTAQGRQPRHTEVLQPLQVTTNGLGYRTGMGAGLGFSH